MRQWGLRIATTLSTNRPIGALLVLAQISPPAAARPLCHLLLRFAMTDSAAQHKRQRLFVAIFERDLFAAELAIRDGADPLGRWESEDKTDVIQVGPKMCFVAAGDAPLAFAANDKSLSVVEFLIQASAGRDAQELARQASEAVLIAAFNGDAQVLRALFRVEGVDPNVGDFEASTPLILAARRRHTEAARVLLENGADLFHRLFDKDDCVFDAMSDALSAESFDIVRLFLRHPGGAERFAELMDLVASWPPDYANWHHLGRRIATDLADLIPFPQARAINHALGVSAPQLLRARVEAADLLATLPGKAQAAAGAANGSDPSATSAAVPGATRPRARSL
jgi:hypothetical protein